MRKPHKFIPIDPEICAERAGRWIVGCGLLTGAQILATSYNLTGRPPPGSRP